MVTSITHFPVEIQTSPQMVPSVPSWFGEVAIVAAFLKKEGVLQAITQQVRLKRGRMGRYEVIDFVALLIGYAISAEPTLQAFFDRLLPFATPFMALFGRDHLPHRSSLSRFLAAVDPPCLEHLRALFQQDLCARPLAGSHEGGLWDRSGRQWHLMDIDGTRAVARQRALPHLPELPSPQRRFDEVCAKGYTGRKRGEVVRTRTVIEQGSTHQWLGTFSGKGNGHYQEELQLGLQVIGQYLSRWPLPLDRGIVRLDGLYGDGAVVAIVLKAGLACLTRGKDYGLLNQPMVQERLSRAPDQETVHPETGTFRQLFDFPEVVLSLAGTRCRVIVATHPAGSTKSPVGKTIEGIVYELFFTTLPQDGFLPADVLALYFGRGGFETVLADEDREQHPDRWCSRRPAGQEFWQILSQWVWNLRIELGHQLHPTTMRTTQLAPAQLPPPSQPCPELGAAQPPPSQPCPEPSTFQMLTAPSSACYGPPTLARPQAGRFAAKAFLPQEDGTLLCPNNEHLRIRKRRPQANGALRVYYAAPRKICQACPLRANCLREGQKGTEGRSVSLVYHPLDPWALPASSPVAPPVPRPLVHPGPFPLLCRDWGRCCTRREWTELLRHQTVRIISLEKPLEPTPHPVQEHQILTPSRRKHWRLSWQERLARNAACELTAPMRLHLFGIPAALATFVGLPNSL
jgi:hypothetical protein